MSGGWSGFATVPLMITLNGKDYYRADDKESWEAGHKSAISGAK